MNLAADHAFLPEIDPCPSANQSTSLKSGSIFLEMVSVRTKRTDQRVKPFFQLVHCLALGAWIIVRLKSCKTLLFLLSITSWMWITISIGCIGDGWDYGFQYTLIQAR